MDYKGIVIEESLENRDTLSLVKIIRKHKVTVTPRHQTPWLTQWTMDTAIVTEFNIEHVAEELSDSFDLKHKGSWYADFKNDKFHYIVFPHKIFRVDLKNPTIYKDAEAYGISLGIPSYQMGFAHLKRKLEE